MCKNGCDRATVLVSRLGLIFLLLAGSSLGKDLSRVEQQEAIESINRLLAENYVYPETATRMARNLTDQLKNGRYDSLLDAEDFAEQVTKDLRAVSQDKHLSVAYDPEVVRRLRDAEDGGPDPALQKERLKEDQRSNFGFQQIKILPGNVGYLELLRFSGTPESGETAVAAMNFLCYTDALIIDLRGNGGGSPSMIQLISSYLFEAEPKHLNSFYWRPKNQRTQTWTLPYIPGKRNPDAEVFVLTSRRTFSAAEEFTYNLKNMKRATIVGETTGGGAHPGGSMPANDDFVVWVPQGRAINPVTDTNWEGTGVTPDIEVPATEALDRAHLEALERLAGKAESDQLKAEYEWALQGLKAHMAPPQLESALLASYAGRFGPRHIQWKDGHLYYQREDGPAYRMLPMTEDLFQFEELDYFRLKILKEDGRVIGVEGLYANGQTDRNMKDL